jgi:quinol monooxygenase YgiN
MSVLVTMQVGPVDWSRFSAALAWLYQRRPAEWISHRVYRGERDPSRVLVIDEWASHADFDAFAARVGAEFNERAGTTGLSWQDEVWVPVETPPFASAGSSG